MDEPKNVPPTYRENIKGSMGILSRNKTEYREAIFKTERRRERVRRRVNNP
jgi:hypothetical protein